MSMQDPISDFLTRIRNGQSASKLNVTMPSSKVKVALAEILKDEGYIKGFGVTEVEGKRELSVELKYVQGQPVISTIRRASRPSLRLYRGKDKLPKVMGGLGITVVSTSRGLMSDRAARAAGQGGEILCYVS